MDTSRNSLHYNALQRHQDLRYRKVKEQVAELSDAVGATLMIPSAPDIIGTRRKRQAAGGSLKLFAYDEECLWNLKQVV